VTPVPPASLRVLLVEDDPRLGSQLSHALEQGGYSTTWLRDARQATPEVARGASLVILGLAAPGASDGLDVLKLLREQCDVPVMVLQSREALQDKLRALRLGADDYLAGPFSTDELLARTAARLRRPVLSRAERGVRLGDLEIDVDQRRVRAKGERVDLTRAEFDLLAALSRRPGAVVSRAFLVANVLDPERAASERTLDVHVSRLRRKLGPCGGQVTTVWGVGYRLEAP
jgi:DNA-binding response OmpR family regulator